MPGSISRRRFLANAPAAVGAATLAPSFFKRALSTSVGYGLFFDDGDLRRIRANFRSDAFASLRARLESVDRAGMRTFIASEVRYNDQLFDIVRLSDTAQAMALQYLMTDDEDAASLAAECIRSIMKFDRWDYFLEAGEKVVGIQRASSTLIAVAVCSDWLAGYVDDEERKQWLEVMRERGCEPCFLSTWSMRYPDQVVGWTRDESSTYFEHRPEDRVDLSRRHIILDTTNLKAVPASALAIGAVCYQQAFGESEATRRWIEQATYSLGTFRDFFERDGSYHEGVSYANYTALNILKATSVLKRFDVADLTDIINWSGYVDYAVGMSMPTALDPYDIVNFGDNGNAKSGEAGRPKRTAVSAWIASTMKDRRAQWFALTLGGEHDEWALIWYDPRVQPESAPSGPSLWRSELDWIVARTGYSSDDLTIAMRSGGPGNHEHADRNSIILKCFGEQLIVDPYRPPYAYRDPRWMMRTTAGHSAVLVGGQGHQYHDGTEGTNASDARARLIRWGERRDYAFWASDATEAYAMVNPDIARVVRSVIVVHDLPLVVVFDSVEKRSQPSNIEARFFGYNHDNRGRVDVVAREESFRMVRPRAELAAAFVSNVGATVTSNQLPIPEDEAVKHPFSAVETAPGMLVGLMTLLVPVAPDETPELALENGGTAYRCQVATSRGIAQIELHDTGVAPEFEVRTAR